MSVAIEKRQPARLNFGLSRLVLLVAILYLLIPLGTTLVFGLSSPKGPTYTYQQIINDANFWAGIQFSLVLALAATLLGVILVTPTAYWVHLRVPKARPLMDVLTLIPFAMPAVIMSLGLIEVYGTPNDLINVLSFGLVPVLSAEPFNIVDTPQLLVCAYVIISLPFVYRPIENSLRAINTATLTEAAYSLGSGWWRTFLTVIVPNIWPGVISAALLTFSTAMGEFTIASLFGLTTFPIYLDVTGQNDAYKAASLAILSFILTLLCVLAIIFLVRRAPGRTGKEGEIEIAAAR